MGARYGQHTASEEYRQQVHGGHDGVSDRDNETAESQQGGPRATQRTQYV